jgi:hypothetical protein
MAAVAIDNGSLPDIPDYPIGLARRARRARSGNNVGKHLSKAVRQRNLRAGKPWWQPSRATKKFKPPRAAARVEAITEELDDRAIAPEDFWAGDDRVASVGVQVWPHFLEHADDYEQERRIEEAVEQLNHIRAQLRLQIQILKSRIDEQASPREDTFLRLRLFDLELMGQYAA